MTHDTRAAAGGAMEQFVHDAVARWREEPDAIEQLVANCVRMNAEVNRLSAALARAEGERDALAERLDWAQPKRGQVEADNAALAHRLSEGETRADALAVALAELRRLLRAGTGVDAEPYPWVGSALWCWASGRGAHESWVPEAKALLDALATDPDARGRDLIEAGNHVREAAFALTTTYLAEPGITLADMKPLLVRLIEALDREADIRAGDIEA